MKKELTRKQRHIKALAIIKVAEKFNRSEETARTVERGKTINPKMLAYYEKAFKDIEKSATV